MGAFKPVSFRDASLEQIQGLNRYLDNIDFSAVEFLLDWAEGKHQWTADYDLRSWEKRWGK